MTTAASKTLLLATLTALALTTTACDGLQDAETRFDLISCAPGSMRVEGSLDGTPIVISQTSATGGWAQTDGGEFGSQANADRDASLADVELQWQKGIVVGASTSAIGTIVMPAGGPFEGETFCAGQGTIVRSAGDGELQWVFKNISGGSACMVPIAGELRGCFQ